MTTCGWKRLHGVVAYVLDYDIVVDKFELKSCYYVLFWTNALGNDTNSLIPSGYELSNLGSVLG